MKPPKKIIPINHPAVSHNLGGATGELVQLLTIPVNIFRKVYNWITKKNMANKFYSVAEILTDLNKDLADKPWQTVDGVFSLSAAKVEKDTVVIKTDSLVLKTFVNAKTGEIRTYIAKVLKDEPETAELP